MTYRDATTSEFGLSLGSNLGDRLANLARARDAVAALPATRIVACSPVYETEPVDVAPAHRDRRYLNAVLIVNSAQAPEALARAMHSIEADLGRTRVPDRNAPRVIDIDMLYAGDAVIRSETLNLPHPRWHERRFVVRPLADVRPDRVLPGHNRSVRDVLLTLPDASDVVLFRREW